MSATSFIQRLELKAALTGALRERGFTGAGGILERAYPARQRVVISRQHHDPADAPDHVAVFGPTGFLASFDLDRQTIERVLTLIDTTQPATL